jgi:DNA-binding MarR family transcriptional regulator
MPDSLALRSTVQKSATAEAGLSGFSLDRSALHLLHRAGQCAEELFTVEFEKWDLTPRQFAVLVAAYENQGRSQTAIVEKTGIDRSTLADLVRRLVKKGLLQRRRTKEDARAYAVRPTDLGRQIVETASGAAAHVDAQLLGDLSATDRDQLMRLLATVINHLQARSAP